MPAAAHPSHPPAPSQRPASQRRREAGAFFFFCPFDFFVGLDAAAGASWEVGAAADLFLLLVATVGIVAIVLLWAIVYLKFS